MNNTVSKELVKEERLIAKCSMEAYGMCSVITLSSGACILVSFILNPLMIETAAIGVAGIGCGVLSAMEAFDKGKLLKDLKVMKSILECNPEAYIPGTKKEFKKKISDAEIRPRKKHTSNNLTQ